MPKIDKKPVSNVTPDRLKILIMALSGDTYKEIAKEYGVSVPRISKATYEALRTIGSEKYRPWVEPVFPQRLFPDAYRTTAKGTQFVLYNLSMSQLRRKAKELIQITNYVIAKENEQA